MLGLLRLENIAIIGAIKDEKKYKFEEPSVYLKGLYVDPHEILLKIESQVHTLSLKLWLHPPKAVAHV